MALRFHSKAGRFIALVPHEALDPHGPKVGFSVVVTSLGVEAFAAGWPCSNLSDQPIRFEFDSAGNLVGQYGGERANGSAVVALCEDAQNFGDKVIQRRRAVLIKR